MRIDAYTKAVLTIIAVALVWIAAGGPSTVPAVAAQIQPAQRVILVGWEDRLGYEYKLPGMTNPAPAPNRTYGLPVQDQ
jgi:hypothetical protein